MLKDLTYIDRSGKEWTAPRGFIVHKNFFPGILQRWVADPFCFKMRRATAVHCFFRMSHPEIGDDVDRMFIEAMQTDGVPYRQRLAIRFGLSIFGRRT